MLQFGFLREPFVIHGCQVSVPILVPSRNVGHKISVLLMTSHEIVLKSSIIDVLTAIPCSLSSKIKDKRESENENKHDCMPLHKLFALLFIASINCGNCLFQSLINFLLMLMLLHTEHCDAPLFIRRRT